jgi:CheY-like chemotaxis protein
VLELALAREGLTVWSAANGPEAVELYQRHRDSISLVLLDVNMGGFNGPCTLAALRRINPAVRAAFVTGGPSEVDELLALGAVAVLPKPFDLPGLTHTVGQLLAG